MIQIIKKFCIRKDPDDWKRELVCGICWMEGFIGINIRRLKLLISRCKSSINGSLQRAGLSIFMGRSESSNMLSRKFPFLAKDNNELRQWTLRKHIEENETFFIANEIFSHRKILPIPHIAFSKITGNQVSIAQEESSDVVIENDCDQFFDEDISVPFW